MRHAFVAEVAPDLEQPLHAAHAQPLEVQLRSDPQVQAHVVGVAVGGERTCVGPAVHRLQDRRLDFEEIRSHQGIPQGVHRRAASAQGLPGIRAHDQVNVALPDPGFGIHQAPALVRQRTQALRGQQPVGGQHRHLTAPRRDDFAGHRHLVADVHPLPPGLQQVRPGVLRGEHHLQVTGEVPQCRETHSAVIAQQHHAPGHRGVLAGPGVRQQVLVAGGDGVAAFGARHRHRIRIDTRGPQGGQLAPAHLLLLRGGAPRHLGFRSHRRDFH